MTKRCGVCTLVSVGNNENGLEWHGRENISLEKTTICFCLDHAFGLRAAVLVWQKGVIGPLAERIRVARPMGQLPSQGA